MLKTHKSLDDVHESVPVYAGKSKFRRIISFIGPAYLISVGYMDPGNWATDLAGGSAFGYTLLWVLLMSNLMALLLQSLSARLGIVRGLDLAQANRETYPKRMNFVLYFLAEIAIAACDLAEILGMAIGLNLLFGLDLIWGVLISFADTFLLLYLQKLGMRKLELFIVGTIALIGGCFMVEMFLAKPDIVQIAHGFIPSLPQGAALYIAIGIIGATVMPHNLYLHSALVQTRQIERDAASIKKAIKYNFIDSAVALNMAFFVNAAILILAASVFHKNGLHEVADLKDAYHLLGGLMGTEWASKLFAIALILAGQSSTVTGTLAGQIVMEGYLRLRISPLLRRLITRLIAILPAIFVILWAGEEKVGELLIFSQVILSMQLAFAVIPLIHFVSDKVKMGEFAIKPFVKVLSWIVALIIAGLNFKLVYEEVASWINKFNNIYLTLFLLAASLGLLFLLLMTIFYPLVKKGRVTRLDVHSTFEDLSFVASPAFSKILLALDFSPSDEKVINQALRIGANNNKVKFLLTHVVESASVKYSGEVTHDFESRKDLEQLKKYVDYLKDLGFDVSYELVFNDRVDAIAALIDKESVDLLIVGSHGHKGIKDLIFGETVNRLRHAVDIPVLIAK